MSFRAKELSFRANDLSFPGSKILLSAHESSREIYFGAANFSDTFSPSPAKFRQTLKIKCGRNFAHISFEANVRKFICEIRR